MARIEDEVIRNSEFEAYLEHNSGGTDSIQDHAILSELFDQFLRERILERMAANTEGIAVSARGAMVEALVARNVAATLARPELEQYYRGNLERFTLPERVDLGQILVAEENIAREARDRLEAGTPFSELVAAVAENPAVSQAWIQRGVEREHLPVAFREIVFALQDGQVSPVIGADYGYLVFQIQRRYAEEVLDFEAAAPEIARVLKDRQRAQARLDLEVQGREQYNVEVFVGNLPFEYDGRFRPGAR